MKKRRVENRKRILEELVKSGNAPFCKKHHKKISFSDIYNKHCYTGNHKRNYCKYLEIDL